jgi:hypothetical protein
VTVAVTSPGPRTAWIRAGWTLTVRWTESDASRVARRSVVRQRGRVDREGVCWTVTWANEWTKAATQARLADTGFVAGYCYRYVVSVTDTLGRTTTARSGPLRTLTAWTSTYNVYRSTAFVTQKTFSWCVAASIQMTLNIAKGTSDRTYATQEKYFRYAQAHDRYAPGVAKGTDPQGWVASLNYYGGTRGYKAVESSSYGSAVRAAVKRLRLTGKPVGVVVGSGSHAWTLHGFVASADPAFSTTFTVSSVYVSGPLYPIQQRNGYDMPPNTRLSYTYFARFFNRHYDRLGPSPWDGSWVTIQP